MKTAAALIIGNEILTGKIHDTNSKFLIDTFYSWGVELKRIVVVPDIEADIVEEVQRLRSSYDLLITSGGIGPTHDDITMQSIAKALGRELVPNEQLRELYARWNKSPDPAVLRKMTSVPSGAELRFDSEIHWPLIRIENVVILPGIPKLFERKLLELADEVKGKPFLHLKLRVDGRESELAPMLIATQESVGVDIGSYPRYENGRGFVWIIFQSKERRKLEAGARDLARRLDAADIPFREIENPGESDDTQ